jgi:hypothetical protein
MRAFSSLLGGGGSFAGALGGGGGGFQGLIGGLIGGLLGSLFSGVAASIGNPFGGGFGGYPGFATPPSFAGSFFAPSVFGNGPLSVSDFNGGVGF